EGADLSKASLRRADLSKAILMGVHLNEADLYGADLSEANLYGADLSEAKLLYGADLSEANPRGTILKGTNLRGVKGLTKEQLGTCKAKGAIIDEDPVSISFQSTVTTPPPLQSNDPQASSTPETDLRKP